MSFKMNKRGQKEFCGGKEDFDRASKIAHICSNFILDVEEEVVVEEERSCYNCRFRRWTAESFVCCKP